MKSNAGSVNAFKRGYTTPQVDFARGTDPASQQNYQSMYGYPPTGAQNGFQPGQMQQNAVQPGPVQWNPISPNSMPQNAVPSKPMQPGPGQSAMVPQNAPFSYQNGYSVPGSYPSYQPQQPAGSFIPQTPYSPGYTTPGYQPGGYVPPQSGAQQPPMNGYQAPVNGGYNPYNQMGKVTPPGGQEQIGNPIPLNGGGYVPPKVPVYRRPLEFREWYILAAGALLIVLFILAVLVFRNPVMKAAVILLAAGSAAFLWIKKDAVTENRRLTYSIVALAVCILTVVSFLIQPGQKDVTNNTGTNSANGQNSASSAVVTDVPIGYGSVSAETPAPVSADNALIDRLVRFFDLWSQNLQDEMLDLCAPSWKAKLSNPRTSLFNLLMNRKPLDCKLESITGTDADTSRRVTLTSSIDRGIIGKKAEKYRMSVLMVKENNEWYIDPQSLQSNELITTPDPNITEAPTPTPSTPVYADTILYYNPKNGEYYHFDQNCKKLNPKYLPLQGSFRYSEINNEPYSKLKPCNVCGAPLRP